jgi:hypothetical protein
MIPHERSLVETWKGKPFAIVGVNTDGREEFEKGMKADPVPWRSFDDGTSNGPICTAWDVQAFPSIFVLDHEGVIRHKGLRGAALEEAVAALVAIAESSGQRR